MKHTAHTSAQAHVLLLLTLVFVTLGSLFVFEASVAESFAIANNQFYLLQQHLIGVALGLAGFVVALKTPTAFWVKTAPIWFLLSIFLLVVVLIPGIGLELNGARRWISLLGVRLQPVEFLKLAIVLYFPLWLAKHQRLGPFATLTAVPLILLLLQPDLGSAIIVAGIAVSLYFAAGGNLKHLAMIGAAGLIAVLLAIFTSDYRMERVQTFLNPGADPLGDGFHVRQMTLALGRGGWFGQGLGNSSQKFSYIPEASTDSIFAIIAEEVGFVGSLILLGALAGFLYLMHSIASMQKDPVHRLLVYGVMSWIGIQTVVNLGAVVGLLPLTGAPLPFFSYGRSAQLMVLFATGLVIRRGLSK